MSTKKTANHINLDERPCGKPLLDQLSGLLEIIDLTDEKQTPAHTFDNFTEVVMTSCGAGQGDQPCWRMTRLKKSPSS